MTANESESAEPSLAARRLRELLQSLSDQGISQAQVARRAIVPAQHLSGVKNSRRPLTELFARRLGEEFGVDYYWLLGLQDSPARLAHHFPDGSSQKLSDFGRGDTASGGSAAIVRRAV